MDVVLRKKPKVKTLIEGFPGFGLVGTISTEYLLEHLQCEQIGEIVSEKLPATVAIHKGKLVHPIGIFYSKKHNLVVIHAILDVRGFEWELADAVKKVVKSLEIKEIISIEGVASNGGEELYCYNSKAFEKLGAQAVNESVIMGVTAALLLTENNLSCIFAETHSNMPDSRAAAKVLEFLEKYLKFEMNTKPLILQAELFESKVKNLMAQTNKSVSEQDKKQMSYLG